MAAPPFAKLLIANRGEIAVRVIRACRELGIESVAVFSEADRGALHTRLADEAHGCGPPAPAESYLDVTRIVDIAVRSGCQAIHPGYGFLSESADLASACAAAGIVFVGPSSEVIRCMGDKVLARQSMQAADVPVVPGSMQHQSDSEISAAAAQMGFPVMVKASAGGGGRGLRTVHDAESLPKAISSARTEAQASFGDGSLYLEKRLERPRHVEVQVLADRHGRVVHLFERECSVQRRHQKLLEEAPAPGLPARIRETMGAAACAAARAVDYEGAGTVEFLLTPDGSFYFLEMNTRIQVEHPVTEAITGVDLVKAQIEIAAGEPLPFEQSDLAATGHAIEARIYAEDPSKRFLPSPGRILVFDPPQGPGVRLDSGVAAGSDVPVHYDALLAKLVVHGADRAQALARLDGALREMRIGGVKTSVPFHRWLVRDPDFRAGPVHTAFVDERAQQGPLVLVEPRARSAALMAAACVAHPEGGRGVARLGKERIPVLASAPGDEGVREVSLGDSGLSGVSGASGAAGAAGVPGSETRHIAFREIAPHRFLIEDSDRSLELLVTPARKGFDVLVEGQHFAIVLEPAVD